MNYADAIIATGWFLKFGHFTIANFSENQFLGILGKKQLTSVSLSSLDLSVPTPILDANSLRQFPTPTFFDQMDVPDPRIPVSEGDVLAISSFFLTLDLPSVQRLFK